MKERIFFDDEFEKQLQEKSDQFKMYPSDKIWNEIHRSLHTKKIRFVAGMGILICGILILAGIQLIGPSKNTISVKTSSKTEAPAETASDFDLNAFNAFAAGSGVSAKPVAHLPKGTFLTFPSLEENAAGFSVADESRSAVQIKSTIDNDGAKSRSADLSLTNMTSPNAPSVSLPNKELETKNLPELAGVSDDNTAATAEKSTPGNHHIRNDRFSWEIYVAPTLSTRNLNGVNYQQIYQTIQNAPITVVRFANVNGFVDNTPAMGYDIGGALLYRLSKSFSLKAGLQFSFSRYYINAFNSNPSQSSASLSSYFGYIADSLTNNSGSFVTPKNGQHYQNKFYQLSMPIGIEWKVIGKGRFEFHLAATLQPSYLLNQDIYVLSSDYSSYSKQPSAIRKWNFNAGADAFVSYRMGNKVRLEMGPMIRYQILSTYKGSYPLKENMTNYGLRIGFSKTIR